MNDDLLLQRYLDRRLSAEDLATFQRRLAEDAALREELRTIAEQAVAFGDFARRETIAPVVVANFRPDKIVRFPWFALAASLAVLATSAWFFIASKPAPVLTLVESTGTVAWNHGEPIAVGAKLAAGTVETVGETSSALLRFRDGTLITLQGEAELGFAEDGQKTLTLDRGTLSAEVKPQPIHRPMLVRTRSAVIEVVGTTFDLSARTEDTLLKVNEGLVKLMRLADGSEIEVPANSSALASLHTDTKLEPASTPAPLTEWGFDFTTQSPPRDWRGRADEGRMNATAYVAKTHDDGRVTTHYGISIRTAMLPQPLRLLATERSAVRYRLRQDSPGALQIMLITRRPEGGFGGNFECRIDAEELQPRPDGWCDLVVPLSRFRHMEPASGGRPLDRTLAGNILTSVLVNSYRENRQLAVSHFALTARP